MEKINKKYIIGSVFILFIGIFISFTQDRKGIKTSEKYNILVSKKASEGISNKLSITKIEDSLFQINYSVPSYLDVNNEVAENVFVDINNLRELSKTNSTYTFYQKPCSKERKKYFILLDISGSVVNKIGKDKYISDLNNNISKIFEKTKLNIGDEIYIGFIGENKEKPLVYDFVGPLFNGSLLKNNVYHETTFEITNYSFGEIAKCFQNNQVTTTQDVYQIINSNYSENTKINNKAWNTYIGDSLKNLKSDLEIKNKYSNLIYILFTDGDDNSNSVYNDQGHDEGFKNCLLNSNKNCGYEFVKYSDRDEAYIFWVNKYNEEKFKLLFSGIKVSFN